MGCQVMGTTGSCPGARGLNTCAFLRRGPHLPYWVPHHRLPNKEPFQMVGRKTKRILSQMEGLPEGCSSVYTLSTGLCPS